MNGFSEYNCKEGISRIALLLSRLTLFGNFQAGTPLAQLKDVVIALSRADVLEAVSSYHALTASLIKYNARRVSGDVWQDYLLSLILETPHEFAKSAAEGKENEAIYAAMRSDLAILGALSTLESDDICRFILEKQQSQKGVNPHTADSIAMSSAALWSGTQIRSVAKSDNAVENRILSHAINEADILSWNYDNAGMEGEYVCDETLEELYHRFSKTSDWRALAEDIWSFFASYGCGEFIKYRSFLYGKNGFEHLSLSHEDTLLPVSFYEMQHRKVLEHTIGFMQGRNADNIIITGGSAVGKTELVLSVFDELPELRLVVCTDEEVSLGSLFKELSKQPLRFMVLIDDMSALKELSSFEAKRLIPKNVLLCATAKNASEDGIFPVRVIMPYPSLNDFTDIVMELLAIYDVSVSREKVRSKAMDYQAKGIKLSLMAAKRIADEYIMEF